MMISLEIFSVLQPFEEKEFHFVLENSITARTLERFYSTKIILKLIKLKNFVQKWRQFWFLLKTFSLKQN